MAHAQQSLDDPCLLLHVPRVDGGGGPAAEIFSGIYERLGWKQIRQGSRAFDRGGALALESYTGKRRPRRREVPGVPECSWQQGSKGAIDGP